MMVSLFRMGAVCSGEDDNGNADIEDNGDEDDDSGFTFLENRSGMILRRWRLL